MTDKSITEIRDFVDLEYLVMNGETNWLQYGYVNTRELDDLIIFNYSSTAQYNNRWNWFECVSRGLIMDRTTGEIVARSFDKFFNWGERGRKGSGYMLNITEKMDGSLGILYKRNGEYKIATRGSLESDQARWATRYLGQHFHEHLNIPDELTLLFEIIYKENRIVVDYVGYEGLILLAARNRHTGEYLPFYPDLYELAVDNNFDLVETSNFNSLVDVIAATGQIDADHEGWVVEMSDGSRWKFKGDQYLEVHKMVSNISLKRVLELVKNESLDKKPEDIPEWILKYPEYVREEVINLRDKIIDRYLEVSDEIDDTFSGVNPDMMTRKEFASWAMADHNRHLSMYLFAMYDDKNIDSLVFKHAFKDWSPE